MSFTFSSLAKLEESTKKLGKQQADIALGVWNSNTTSDHEKVHEIRKCLKKLRGLIRLVRANFKNYKRENKKLRNWGRALSNLRDAKVRLETVSKLQSTYGIAIPSKITQQLKLDLDSETKNILGTEEWKSLPNQFRNFKDQIDNWSIDKNGFDGVKKGLRKTYERGVSAMMKSLSQPTMGHYHEWRKRAKYHRYHIALLQSAWPELLTHYEDLLHQFTDALGEDHDLAELNKFLLDENLIEIENPEHQKLLAFIRQRQLELKLQGDYQGVRLFSIPPKKFVNGLQCYWGKSQLQLQEKVLKSKIGLIPNSEIVEQLHD